MMSHFRGDKPVTTVFAILLIFTAIIDHGDSKTVSSPTYEVYTTTPFPDTSSAVTSDYPSTSPVASKETTVVVNTALMMTTTAMNDTVKKVTEFAQKITTKRTTASPKLTTERITAAHNPTAKKTTIVPTTPAKKTTVATTTPAKKTTVAPKTTAKKTTVAPTLPAKKTTVAPTTLAKKTTAAPTTPAKKTTVAPTLPAKKTTVAPTTPAKKTTAAPTTPAKKTTVATTTPAKKTTAAPKTTAKKTTVAPKTPAKKTTAAPTTKTTKKPKPTPTPTPSVFNFFNFTKDNQVCILENITAEFVLNIGSSENISVPMTEATVDIEHSQCGNHKSGKNDDAILMVRWDSSHGDGNSLKQTYSVDGGYYYLKSYNLTLVTSRKNKKEEWNAQGNLSTDTFRTKFGRSLTCARTTTLTYHGDNFNVTLKFSDVKLQAFDVVNGNFSSSYECGTNPDIRTVIYIVIAVVTGIVVIAAIAIAFCIYKQKTAPTRAGYESV